MEVLQIMAVRQYTIAHILCTIAHIQYSVLYVQYSVQQQCAFCAYVAHICQQTQLLSSIGVAEGGVE